MSDDIYKQFKRELALLDEYRTYEKLFDGQDKFKELIDEHNRFKAITEEHGKLKVMFDELNKYKTMSKLYSDGAVRSLYEAARYETLLGTDLKNLEKYKDIVRMPQFSGSGTKDAVTNRETAAKDDEAVNLNVSVVEQDDTFVATATVHPLVDNTPALEDARAVLNHWFVSPGLRKNLEKVIADEQAGIKEMRDGGEHEAADKREKCVVWWVRYYALRGWVVGIVTLLNEARKMIGGG